DGRVNGGQVDQPVMPPHRAREGFEIQDVDRVVRGRGAAVSVQDADAAVAGEIGDDVASKAPAATGHEDVLTSHVRILSDPSRPRIARGDDGACGDVTVPRDARIGRKVALTPALAAIARAGGVMMVRGAWRVRHDLTT